MKLPAFLLIGILLLSMLITPIVELLCAFTDMCRINAAAVSCSRSAVLTGTDERFLRDAEAVIKLYDSSSSPASEEEKGFLHKFVESFCVSLDLDMGAFNDFTAGSGTSHTKELLPKKNNRFDKFKVTITPLSDFKNELGQSIALSDPGTGNPVYNKCRIELETPYVFQTSQMKKMAARFPGKVPNIKVKWTQTLYHIPTAKD